MSGYHNNYEADLVDLRQAPEVIGGMAGAPKKLRGRFQGTVAATSAWNGQDDEFHGQTEAQDKRQIESCLAVVDSLDEFLTGWQSAIMKSLGSIEDVHQDVQDRIHDAQSNAGEHGSGGHGKH
ncbi:hypothetical protein ACIQKE_19225 [Streptomyces griseoviridis]|uniref:Uncharacterized protein n=1 Tax=Streptomyces griseoviridis TaxID=45398 RepID=A0A3S9ZM36_STRGD|nr:hypothetical protein [Streptomyces griseoviridis]AZS88748.1 hypothetical protein ELQ87_34285 [Streptomyces griseoviridis]QCN84412.1 hypothetical protein DDJ31_04970 [Streptomyces griseoviridis]